jgi:hypothetical protein
VVVRGGGSKGREVRPREGQAKRTEEGGSKRRAEEGGSKRRKRLVDRLMILKRRKNNLTNFSV